MTKWGEEYFPDVCTEWSDVATIETCRTIKKFTKNGGWCGVVWCGVVWCGVMWCRVVGSFLLFYLFILNTKQKQNRITCEYFQRR